MFSFLVGAGILAVVIFLLSRSSPAPRAPPKTEPAHATTPLPERPFAVEDLGSYLDERRRDQETEEQAERDRLQLLRDNWSGVQPAVHQAIAIVNSQLAGHEMRLVDSAPDFFSNRGQPPSGFGIECSLEGADQPLAYEGVQCVAVSEEHFFVGGMHHWSEAKELPLKDPPVGAIADALAETVKWQLQG